MDVVASFVFVTQNHNFLVNHSSPLGLHTFAHLELCLLSHLPSGKELRGQIPALSDDKGRGQMLQL